MGKRLLHESRHGAVESGALLRKVEDNEEGSLVRRQ
jgi:hypothetical protein